MENEKDKTKSLPSSKERITQSKTKSLLDVASALGMDLKQNTSGEWEWRDHDSFKINARKNTWSWYSHSEVISRNGKSFDRYRNQDALALVQLLHSCSFAQALKFVNQTQGTFFDPTKVARKMPFKLTVPLSASLKETYAYLTQERKLSTETVDFFVSQGSIAQGSWKNIAGQVEPVIVFESRNWEGKCVGGTLQGILPNRKVYGKRMRLKHILKNSDGMMGFSVDIGSRQDHRQATPEQPFRLYAFEAPIDLMSFYELHHEELSNCRLVSMNGLKLGVLSAEFVHGLVDSSESLKHITSKSSPAEVLLKEDQNGMPNVEVVICVDHDEKGLEFLNHLPFQKINYYPWLPPLHGEQTKNDWNDELKFQKNQAQLKTFVRESPTESRATTASPLTGSKQFEEELTR